MPLSLRNGASKLVKLQNGASKRLKLAARVKRRARCGIRSLPSIPTFRLSTLIRVRKSLCYLASAMQVTRSTSPLVTRGQIFFAIEYFLNPMTSEE